MDELHEFCARMLGDREAAVLAAEGAIEAGGNDRLRQIAHALHGCRASGEREASPSAKLSPARGDLTEAVAAELAAATACLGQRQREALALRELLRLSHEQVAAVMEIEPTAVALLLARSRLRLQAELRGTVVAASDCPERERTLRTATLRQDSELVPSADDDWLVDHLGHCADCARAHGAMLEGSVCYRGWRVPGGAAVAPR